MNPNLQAVQAVLQALGLQLLGDGAADAKVLLTNFFTNVKKTPTVANVIAQSAILQASFLAMAPQLEGQALAQICDSGIKLVDLIPMPTKSA